jgi:hypothetical protein
MVKHTLDEFVLPYIDVVVSVITSFDLWMNKSAFDTFALMINFLTLDWEPKHVTIGLFEAKCITRINLICQLQVLFEEYR